MLCSICQEREATVHLTNITGDKVQKVDLCEECAKSKGMNDPAGFSFADELLGLGASQEIEQAGGEKGLQCPVCGFAQSDFKKAGRLGCAECYQTFAEPMKGLLKTMHKRARHVGKVPESLRQSCDLSVELKQLQQKLAKAIALENFEEAAVLRDEIKQTTAQLSQRAANRPV
ncbi:MAG TPA: UvrB/UvrC motif-containing protein [Verrucomicrobiota bacterium]|jgi:protein arginine kinase activator|nr:UvrB/UvrC motif-containing protein [Verrucomicrobiota bacterium]HQL78001.1 UvrB/UvrC motif-containing protein [Verrucomicrobiota bacterium]